MHLSKYILLAILQFTCCSLTFASKVDESYFVFSNSLALKKSIMLNPQLVLDHPSSKGFEVYGPKGLGEYLKGLKVRYVPLEQLDGVFKKTNKISYPSYNDVVSRIKSAVTKYSKFMKLFSVGKTVEGRDLWVVKISDNVTVDEVEPEFKYISSMHGDEIVGRELMQNFIEDIGAAYVAGDKEITKLVNEAEIFIMPSMNPDGSEKIQRGNGNNVDLNRNFPDPFSSTSLRRQWNNNGGFQGGRMGNGGLGFDEGGSQLQPETVAVMKFQEERNFALSANFHGGAVVFNYPWDSIYDRHPLNDFLIDISLDYSKLNLPMWNSGEFERGITNGADWYIVKGGMQDWSYVVHNDLQFTIELSDIKYPNFSEIPKFYKDNKESLIAFMNTIFQGAGFQFNGQKMQSGLVEVIDASGKNLGKFPWKRGEFYKVLPAGAYVFNVLSAQGSLLKKINVEVGQSDFARMYKI